MATVPYLLQIFYNPNGSLMGATLNTRTVDDTGVFPDVTNPAVDLALEGNDAFALPAVLGATLATALDANTALQAANTAQASQITALQDQISALQHFGTP